jgi:hypothetical protein
VRQGGAEKQGAVKRRPRKKLKWLMVGRRGERIIKGQEREATSPRWKERAGLTRRKEREGLER